jgi:8-oxo-dGTP pyrophosphatase MutT (NUDIX family)
MHVCWPEIGSTARSRKERLLLMKRLKQVGAIPVRRAEDGSFEVLLITSRRTGKWIIPKGWPSRRLANAAAAAREAEEEAGVIGRVTQTAIGTYGYRKSYPSGVRDFIVEVFLLVVEKELKSWREETERARSWFKPHLAAIKVHEPRLADLILGVEQPALSPTATAINTPIDCYQAFS